MDEIEIIAYKWDEFKEWFRGRWQPGEHLAIVAPTGAGKTTFMVGILPQRKYVIAIDPKGGDSTLAALKRHGFQESSWPPSKEVYKAIEEGKPARLIVGSHVRNTADLPRLRGEIARALNDAFDQTGWTIYLDELQIVADRRLMGLSASVERNLIAARDRKVSMVSSFQRPANVPRTASEMATWFGVYYTRDGDTVDRLAQMAGRSAAEIRGMIRGLPQYCLMLFSRNPREPVVITRADEA